VTTYVALFRAVNVGGTGKVSMAALKAVATGLGFEQPQTLLNSGNLVFRAPATKSLELERSLEREVSAHLGVTTVVVVRSAAEWLRVIARNPFPAEAAGDPGHLLVMALKDPVKSDQVARVRAAIKGREVVGGDGREIYLVYPDGAGTSRLTSAVIEKAIGTRGTARNWNTTLKLASMMADH
jgi:uncharacterized protein (DUF1697 family)